MHLPLICDRYEVRDDVPPGAGKFRGGAGVVKSQRYLTPGFMTHEFGPQRGRALGHLRRQARPWQQGRAAEYRRPARSSTSRPSSPGLRTDIGDVITYYSPVGGGYGDPLERDPHKVLDDVLDGFITSEHARDDYGVVLRAGRRRLWLGAGRRGRNARLRARHGARPEMD